MNPPDNLFGVEIDLDADSSLPDDVSVLSDWSVEDFHHIKLYDLKLFGRHTEVSILRSAFDRVCTSGKSEIALCHGLSGVGKTKFIFEALNDPVVQRDGLFVTGKFDQHNKAPFSALVTAFSDVCDVVRHSPKREEIRKAVKHALGSEIKVLTRLVPGLSYLMGEEVGESVSGVAGNSMKAFIRFKILCRHFLQCVSSADNPVVFMLDDLQWADEASLEVIRSFLVEELRYVLFVCSYRDDEESSNSRLQSILNTLCQDSHENSKPYCVPAQSIHLTGLDLEEMNEMIASITFRKPQDTMPLSTLIMKKTLGNSYFCLQFLEMLERQEYLYFSAETKEWEWNLELITLDTNAADNVAALVSDKMHQVQKSIQLVLLYCAYLGYQFAKSVLKAIILAESASKNRGGVLDDLWTATEGECGRTLNTEEAVRMLVDETLTKAITHDLIETTDKVWYKFAHDRVQESLLWVIQEEDACESVHLRIGRVLYSLGISDSDDDDYLKFIAVNNLNLARRSMTLPEQTELAHFNWEVAELAATKCAYHTARDYLLIARDLLNEQQCWDTNYHLCLKVHDSLAEFQLCSGNARDSQEIVDVIVEKARLRKDKMKAYLTQLSILSSEGRLEEAMKFGLGILCELGIKFPRNPGLAHVFVELMKAKCALRNLSYNDILIMPHLHDAEMEAGMKLLSLVGLCAFFLHEAGKMMFVLICLRGLRLACKLGLSSISPQAFAAYGTILSILGDYDTAIKYAHLSKKVSDEIEAQTMEARCIVVTHGIILQWKTPLADLREGFMRGYRLGMENADIEYSFYNLHDYIMIPFQLGYISYSELEEQAASFCQQVYEFQTKNLETIALPMHQALINFLGRNEVDPSRLFGEVADEKSLSDFAEQTGNQTSKLVIDFHRLILAYQFQNTAVLSAVVRLVEKQEKSLEGHYILNFTRFYTGMAYFFLYKVSGLRCHRTRARKVISIFQRLAIKGIANVKPLLSVLKMEQTSILHKSSQSVCEIACQTAFDEAGKEGFNITLAIAYERAACIMMHHGNFSLAYDFIGMAIEVYCNLDAIGKVDFLEEHYRNLREKVHAASGHSGLENTHHPSCFEQSL